MSRPPDRPRHGILRTLLALVGGTLDGFVVGFAIAFVVATTMSGAGQALGLGTVGDMLVTGAVVVAVVGVLWGALVAVSVLAARIRDRLVVAVDRRALPRPVRAVVVLPFRMVAGIPRTLALMAALLVLIVVLAPNGPGKLVSPDGILAPFLWFGSVVGAGLGLARTSARRIPAPARVARTVVTGAGVTVAVVVGGYGLGVLFDPGSVDHLLRPGPQLDGPATTAGLEDPGSSGPYPVTTFTYGSGTDRRAAFGSDVRLRTPVVDASRALDRLGAGNDELRSWYWGFGTDALPLNARVWMPAGGGPFPLVLIVHGNHAMGVESEAGYAYLAEHLASRGFIAASVDESFLNGSWAGDYKGDEQAVRAWLLLLHLDQWRAWNDDPDGSLAGRVDMGRVALIGHSRGGEAAAVAASLADLDGSFNPMLRPWPTGLAVHAVVAIAPSDGQYGPNVRLDDVDLLELTGGHDADARAWSGIRQYNRTSPRDGGFKAALYAYRANHGQFNTTWGRGDQGPWSGALLDTRPLATAEDQQDVARTAISAFLEATLHDRTAYRGFFARPMVGREWLPDDIYLVRSDDGHATPLVDVAGAGGAADGLTMIGQGLASARGGPLPLRALQDDQAARAATLAWVAAPGEASWGVSGLSTAAGAQPTARSELRLALGNATLPPTGGASDGAAGLAPLDPLVAVTSTDGVTVALPLSTWGALPPPLAARLVKNDLVSALAAASGLDLTLRSPAELVIQGYAIPLSAFAAADPAFVPERVDRVELRIPSTSPGRLAVAGFGLAP